MSSFEIDCTNHNDYQEITIFQTELSSEHTYQQINASENVSHLVDSFWMHQNLSDEPQEIDIIPDSFFKIIFIAQQEKIVKYFMTGLWTEANQFVHQPNITVYGCRLKILAPEYLLQRSIAPMLNQMEDLDFSFLNIQNFDLSSFEKIVRQWEESILLHRGKKEIHGNKIRLTQLLYQLKGEISAKEVSNQIFWSNRQINRYLNKYIGVSLKQYLNIQKVYNSYIQIKEGKFFPEKDFYDQAHFIREVKKHTGETPSTLHKEQNDRFIQLRNTQEK